MLESGTKIVKTGATTQTSYTNKSACCCDAARLQHWPDCAGLFGEFQWRFAEITIHTEVVAVAGLHVGLRCKVVDSLHLHHLQAVAARRQSQHGCKRQGQHLHLAAQALRQHPLSSRAICTQRTALTAGSVKPRIWDYHLLHLILHHSPVFRNLAVQVTPRADLTGAHREVSTTLATLLGRTPSQHRTRKSSPKLNSEPWRRLSSNQHPCSQHMPPPARHPLSLWTRQRLRQLLQA